ncbi:MAG: hypothetical protein WD690_05715 [Vicinamibacterales bacterium]
MKRAIFSGILAVLFTAGALAQAKPDFSGTWTLDPEKSVMGGRQGGGGRGGGRGGAAPITITVEGSKLSVARQQGENTVTTVYLLDGTVSKNTQAGRQGGEPTEVTYTSKWDGAKLVTTIVNPRGTSTETRWIDADGTMVVETTRTGQDGTPQVTKLVYKKG